jgi:serine beta-lactamase-like protein LACTB, mitochondrial
LRMPLALAITLLVLPSLADAQTLSRVRADSLDKVISAYMSLHGIPGLSAAVALDGEVVWSRGYGLADVENSVPAGPETAYRSASIGKSITATAAMRLVEQGTLVLDRPIQEYCPAFPKKPWAITPRQLLSHTSGIRHYGGPRDREEQTSTVHYATVGAALTPFMADSLLFEPGTQWSYSTYGYDVLGCVIEGAAGEPFMEVIRRNVFAPCGMTHSRDDDPTAIIPHRAAGYVRVKGELRIAPHVDMSNRLPAGGYITTAPDLAAFAAQFIDCRLVGCATRDAMLSEVRLKNGDTVNYGLGWAIGEDQSGHPDGTALHGGSSPGASGILFIVPKRRLAVAVLSNLEDAPERADIVRTIGRVVVDSLGGP